MRIFDLSTEVAMKADREDVVPVPFLKEDLSALKGEVEKVKFSTQTSLRGLEAKLKKQNPDT